MREENVAVLLNIDRHCQCVKFNTAKRMRYWDNIISMCAIWLQRLWRTEHFPQVAFL